MVQLSDVYLNNSGVRELSRLPGVDEARACTIIEARPFDDWSELQRANLSQDEINQLKSCGAQLGEAPSGPIGEAGSGGSGGEPQGNLGRA